MSSVKSPVLTSSDQDALQSAVIDVCENAYFVFVESCDAPQFQALVEQVRAERGRGPSGRWLNAAVGVSRGVAPGLVEVVLPERLGTWLVVSLLGLPPDIDDQGPPAARRRGRVRQHGVRHVAEQGERERVLPARHAAGDPDGAGMGSRSRRRRATSRPTAPWSSTRCPWRSGPVERAKRLRSKKCRSERSCWPTIHRRR